MSHIVIVDDDADLTRMIRSFLERHDFSVDVIRTGEGACEKILQINPDLLILDLMLPGVNGMEICRQVRPDFHQPILMLTALADDIDQIAGLNQGADDYLPKPLKPDLLLARINALLRRPDGGAAPAEQRSELCCGALTIDPKRRLAQWSGEPLALGVREFDLLHYLALHCGEVLTRDRLYQAVFQSQYNGLDRGLDVSISRLRNKIPNGGKWIKTLRGQGYILVPGDDGPK